MTAVELAGITKRFPGVVANHDIHLSVRKGTVHALVGENGAGKSTLMKILYGMQKPDEGTIAVDGDQVTFSSPADAIARGIGMVHQHFMLADNLTVLENVVLGSEKLYGIGAKARRKILELSERYGLGVRPDVLVEELGVADRQRVEILKVLYRGARILILDEPTAVLVPQEVDALFANLRELKVRGPVGHLHLAQAGRGPVGRRRHHGHPPRHDGRHRRPVRDHPASARRADGRQRAADPGDRRVHGHRPAGPHRRPTCAWSPPAARPSSTTSPSPSTRARSWASPVSRATARPS